MRITKLRIKGFESFSDSDELHFGNGINLIVGQNNVGKSAILRSMLFPLANHRHRTDTKWAEHELPAPKVSMMIDVSGAEVASGILRFGRDIRIPVPSEQGAAKFLQDFWAKPSIIFDITIVATNHFRQTSYPSHGLFVLDGNNQISFRAKGENGEISINGPLY
ncbi:MAG: AAA family ATPase, partial [Sphingobium sp.]